jgi:sulfatase modifying factor 1
MANTWQGEFPRQNRNDDGYERTSPVSAFPPNGYGVHDMIGNVWEWTADWYSPKHRPTHRKLAAFRRTRAAGVRRAAMTLSFRTSGFRAR